VRRLALIAALGACVCGAGAASGAAIVPSVTVNGPALAAPITLKTSELAALPQQTLTVTIGGKTVTESGPSVASLLTYAGIAYNATCKNDELRYWIEATNNKGAAAVFTAGEADPGFGNKTTILSIDDNGQFLTGTGPRLVMANDVSGARDLQQVRTITVGRAIAQLPAAGCATTGATTAPTPGSVVINGDVANPTTLTWAQLQAMTQTQANVSFLQGTTPQTHTESGPLLDSIVAAAKPKFLACDPTDDLRFYVEITSGEDGYTATMSYAEFAQSLDANGSLLSLIEDGKSQQAVGPRSTAPGDVKGGRYVSGVAVITIFRAPTQIPIPSCAKKK
jgi:hypothetical protein